MLREIEQGLEIAWNLWDRPKEVSVTRITAIYVRNKGSLYYTPPYARDNFNPFRGRVSLKKNLAPILK